MLDAGDVEVLADGVRPACARRGTRYYLRPLPDPAGNVHEVGCERGGHRGRRSWWFKAFVDESGETRNGGYRSFAPRTQTETLDAMLAAVRRLVDVSSADMYPSLENVLACNRWFYPTFITEFINRLTVVGLIALIASSVGRASGLVFFF